LALELLLCGGRLPKTGDALSLRFLGRKDDLATIVVLVAIMREGATGAQMRQLTAVIGVDRRMVALAGMVAR
jgi:hypothetical protein